MVKIARSKLWSLMVLVTASMAVTNTVHAKLPANSFYQHFSNTHFINQEGKTFAPEKYLGKVVLINFIFTKCSNTCPIQVSKLVSINHSFSAAYQQKIEFISISVDSQFDNPKVLKTYAKLMGAEANNMQFFSGDFDDIVALQEKLPLFGNTTNPAYPKVDLQKLKSDAKEELLDNHITTLWVVDKKGSLIQRYTASPMDVKRLERELKQIADL